MSESVLYKLSEKNSNKRLESSLDLCLDDVHEPTTQMQAENVQSLACSERS